MNAGNAVRLTANVLSSALALSASVNANAPAQMPNMLPLPNASGFAATYNTSGTLDLTNPFFQTLGTNGRACVSCHQPSDGWTIAPKNVQARFDLTDGTDPIFRLNDGANSPLFDVSTIAARRSAYSMLLDKGLIRVGIGMPDSAEFELVGLDDPYGYASAQELSLFRRPLPSTNLRFLSAVMWDGRETFADPLGNDCIAGTTRCFATIHFDLADQSNKATMGHAQAPQSLTTAQREAIVGFEMGLYTSQIFDNDVGELTARQAKGGPEHLSGQDYYFGINDVIAGDYRTGAPFDPAVFKLYDGWESPEASHGVIAARNAIARGQRLFNSKPIQIAGVNGLNDDLGITSLRGTCTTCHDTPGSGNHSVPALLNIGLTDASRRTPDLPLYTLRNNRTHETVQTTDPGRALVTGRWNDIGKFKGPILRALAARAPYFHNGSAADLGAVVDFYDQRFSIGFTEAEKADLIAFLKTL